MFKSRKLVGVLACLGTGLGLIGGGVYATYQDSATAQESLAVGGFGCQINVIPDPNTPNTVTVSGNSVTIDNPPILQSNAHNDNYLANITLTNTGTIPAVVHWSLKYNTPDSTDPLWMHNGGMIDVGSAPVSIDAQHPYKNAPYLDGGDTSPQYGIGYMWSAALDNRYPGQHFSVTYTAKCDEVPPPATSKVQFVGYASEVGHAALSLPAGSQPGDLAVEFGYGSSSHKPGTPTGYTKVNGTVQEYTLLDQKILAAGDTTVPATTDGLGRSVAVYRGATGIGANTYGNTSNGLPPESPNYPLYCPALGAWNGQILHKTDASSWVGCMTHDTGNTTGDVRQMTFNKVISTLLQVPPYTPPVLDGSITVNRSAGAVSPNFGLADTNGGVADWDANDALHVQGGYIMPLSTTNHQTETYAFEILSQ